MVPGLIGLYALRDHLEQAIAALESVLPALEAWQAAQERAPAPGGLRRLSRRCRHLASLYRA
jgi:hypothetical protein